MLHIGVILWRFASLRHTVVANDPDQAIADLTGAADHRGWMPARCDRRVPPRDKQQELSRMGLSSLARAKYSSNYSFLGCTSKRTENMDS
jgi:hypothetical protein